MLEKVRPLATTPCTLRALAVGPALPCQLAAHTCVRHSAMHPAPRCVQSAKHPPAASHNHLGHHPVMLTQPSPQRCAPKHPAVRLLPPGSRAAAAAGPGAHTPLAEAGRHGPRPGHTRWADRRTAARVEVGLRPRVHLYTQAGTWQAVPQEGLLCTCNPIPRALLCPQAACAAACRRSGSLTPSRGRPGSFSPRRCRQKRWGRGPRPGESAAGRGKGARSRGHAPMRLAETPDKLVAVSTQFALSVDTRPIVVCSCDCCLAHSHTVASPLPHMLPPPPRSWA